MDNGKLVVMANQIGRFYARQPEASAAVEVAAHIKKFWERRMRAAIYAHLDAGGDGLDPAVRRGLEALRHDESVGAEVGEGSTHTQEPLEA